MINKTSKLNTRILTYSIVGLVLLFFSVMPATALIIGIPGNQPVKDGGFYPGTWPPGAVELANLPTRTGGWEGPPYGGGEYTFLYRCQKTEQFNEALKIFAAIIAPKLELVIHDGPKYDPIDKTRMDWIFTVWNSEKWNEAYKRAVKFPELSKGLSPSHPIIDVYIGGGNIIWEEVKVPENISVTDQRSKSVVKQTGAIETPVEFKKNKEITVGIDYSGVSPKELLDILKGKVAEHQAFNGGMASKNWITKEDVKYLMTLIDSQEPCLPVVSPITSDFYSDIKSTVGKEALFLIEGYRLGRYPPIVSSVCFKPDIAGIKVWWAKQDGETFASLGLPKDNRVGILFQSMRDKTYTQEKWPFNFPALGWSDIPNLIKIAESERMLQSYPVNDIPSSSSFAFESSEYPEGMIALWLIEGIRKFGLLGPKLIGQRLMVGPEFPSLNPICFERGKANTTQEIHRKAYNAYSKWWRAVKDLPKEEAVKVDPLKGTGLDWWGRTEKR